MARRVDGDPKKDITLKEWLEITKKLYTGDNGTFEANNMFKNADLDLCKDIVVVTSRIFGEATRWGMVKMEQKIGGVKSKSKKKNGRTKKTHN